VRATLGPGVKAFTPLLLALVLVSVVNLRAPSQ
jgi:hypothetical protein